MWPQWVFNFACVTSEELLITVPASSIYSGSWISREQNHRQIENLIMQLVLWLLGFFGFFFLLSAFLKYYISFKKTISSNGRVHWVIYLQFDKTSKNPLAGEKEAWEENSSAVKPLGMGDVGMGGFFAILFTGGLFFSFGFPGSESDGRTFLPHSLNEEKQSLSKHHLILD